MSVEETKTLQRLIAYNGSPSPILTIYFRLFSSKIKQDDSLNQRLEKIIMQELTSQQREEMKSNIEYILGFLENYQPSNYEKTLAIFSGGSNLFEVLHLPYEIEPMIKFSHDPYLDPLLQAQEDSRRFLIILNDREKALFYTIYSGTLEDQEAVTSGEHVPQDVKGRWPESPHAQRDDKVQRHIHDYLSRHYDFIAGKAAQFINRKPITGVVLGGHKDQMSQFEKHLPKHLRDKVVGKFVSELHVNFNKIMARSKAIIDSSNQELNHHMHFYSG